MPNSNVVPKVWLQLIIKNKFKTMDSTSPFRASCLYPAAKIFSPTTIDFPKGTICFSLFLFIFFLPDLYLRHFICACFVWRQTGRILVSESVTATHPVFLLWLTWKNEGGNRPALQPSAHQWPHVACLPLPVSAPDNCFLGQENKLLTFYK